LSERFQKFPDSFFFGLGFRAPRYRLDRRWRHWTLGLRLRLGFANQPADQGHEHDQQQNCRVIENAGGELLHGTV
jgi:hypothetical protein